MPYALLTKLLTLAYLLGIKRAIRFCSSKISDECTEKTSDTILDVERRRSQSRRFESSLGKWILDCTRFKVQAPALSA